MENLEFKIDFTDRTLNEADGKYKRVKDIMSKEVSGSSRWVVRSEVSVSSNMGMCMFEIQCHEDGRLYLLSYAPSSVGDVYYNPDIQVISQFAQENGWCVPEPSESLIRSNKHFWKHFWETLLIDSKYLDDIYGKRPQLEGS